MSPGATILLVEDNRDDEALTTQALREAMPANVTVAHDGEEAISHLLDGHAEPPRLVLLDLKLPAIDGLEVLRLIRENDRTRLTPVVILTSSGAPVDIERGYRHGANSYVRKPTDFDRFAEVIRQIGHYWLGVNEPPSTGADPAAPGLAAHGPRGTTDQTRTLRR